MNFKVNKCFILIFVSAVLWGIAGVFVKSADNYNLSEMQLVFWRTAFTSLILGISILLKDKKLFKIKVKDLWIFALAGVLSIVLFNYSYYKTMHLSTLSVAAVLLYTAPFFVVIFSVILFKEKLNVNKILALFIAFLGCCFVSEIFSLTHRISGFAVFFGLLTGFGYGLYTIFGNVLLKRGYRTLTITFYIFLFAALFTIPFIDLKQTVVHAYNTPFALFIAFLMAVFNTVLPYIFYTNGLKGVDPSVAPIIATVEPVVATVVGLFYGETIRFSGVLGIILVLISVLILNFKSVRIKAFAKINLSLGITGKRKDGYHLIDTVMQSVSLCDKITISPSKNIIVKCPSGEIPEKENIAFAAAKLFFEESGIPGGAKIKIRKNIPMSAGLGGGSADAAAVLLGLNTLYNTHFSEEKLCEMALKLGADVPFFIKGGTVRAQGIGEILTKIAPLKQGYFILAKGETKPSTKEMYRRIDSETLTLPNTNAVVSAIENSEIDKLSKLFINSFSGVWEKSFVKERLIKLSPRAVSLSGSGPTWFAYFTDKKMALKALRQLKNENFECYFVKPLKNAIIFE